MTRVAVLKGGWSLERQVSLRSGGRVEAALRRLGHDVVAIDAGNDLVTRLRAAEPDVAFVALHGRHGEDGTVQEILEAIDIPYTGSGVAACIRCADKVLAKHELRRAGIPTPEFFAFTERAFKDLGAGETLDAIIATLGLPLVIKPAGQGSALGIKFVHEAREMAGALVASFSYGDKVLLEQHVAGRDLAVSVLEEPSSPPRAVALPVIEAIPQNSSAYEARYEIGAAEFRCPAELPDDLAARARELALRVWDVLGCAGFGRVDLMLSDDGALTVLEADTVPGLTDTSLLPQAADAAGISFDEVMGRLVEMALVRAE